jgi:hypothetical protein
MLNHNFHSLQVFLTKINEDLLILNELSNRSLNIQHRQDRDVLKVVRSEVLEQLGLLSSGSTMEWTNRDYEMALDRYQAIHSRMETPIPYTLVQKNFMESDYNKLMAVQLSARVLHVNFQEYLIPSEIRESFERKLKEQAERTVSHLNKNQPDVCVTDIQWKHNLRNDLIMSLVIESNQADDDLREKLVCIMEDAMKYAAMSCQKNFSNPWITEQNELIGAFRSMA